MFRIGQKKDKQRIEAMSSQERTDMIRRLEREREKINSEIESLLSSYAKESGNRELLPKRRGDKASEDYFEVYEE